MNTETVKAVEAKKFHLGHILSITTRMLCPVPDAKYPIEAIYEIVDFMEGGEHYTIGLPSAADRCKPYLLEQFPELTNITDADIYSEPYDGGTFDTKNHMAELVAKYGEWFEVKKIS